MADSSEVVNKVFICAVETCKEIGKFRCSQCQCTYYCTGDHQRIHWKAHKSSCKKSQDIKGPSKTEAKTNTDSKVEIQESSTDEKEGTERRICRCMFCGEELILASEDEAITHMTVCPALQEQLQAKEDIHIPSMVREKMQRKHQS